MADPSLRYHWLRLRATAHPTEDPEKVRRALLHASGLEADAFDAALEETVLESHHGGEVHVLEVALTRSRDIRTALEAALDQGTRRALMPEVDARVDDECVFTFRLDKQSALEGRREPTRGDDAIQFRLRVEVHPARRQAAVEAMRRFLAPAG